MWPQRGGVGVVSATRAGLAIASASGSSSIQCEATGPGRLAAAAKPASQPCPLRTSTPGLDQAGSTPTVWAQANGHRGGYRTPPPRGVLIASMMVGRRFAASI